MKIEDIAQVIIGVLTKRENEENGQNEYSLFSLKNYEENNEYEKLKTNKNIEDKVARNGDLLFRLLYPNRIIYVDEKIEGMLIPSQFCIIRTNKSKMDSIVLKWYLESNSVQEELKQKVTGSIIKSMTVANLRTLDIPYIPIEQQEKMKQLIILWEKEKQISKQIIEEKEKLYYSYLEKTIKRGEDNVKKTK